jgi:para-aminobenzoate synthetase
MAPALVTRPGRILYLDAYDSFSNNIIALVEQTLDVKVVRIYIDDSRFLGDLERFTGYLKNFDAVIAGPGPGTVTEEKDVGLIKMLWNLKDADLLPVFGICLGFQSLAAAFGGSIQPLKEPRHGLVAEILHKDYSIFRNLNQVYATQYHSLEVYIGHMIQWRRGVQYPSQLWEPSYPCPELEPLAWDFDNRRNGAVLMAVRHISKPFWGVQFHPESICTNEEGNKVLQNWWSDAQAWIRERIVSAPHIEPTTSTSHRPSLSMSGFNTLLGMEDMEENSEMRQYSRSNSVQMIQVGESTYDASHIAHLLAHGDSKTLPDLPPDTVHVATCGSGRLKVHDVCELLDIPRGEAVVLESCVQDDLLPIKAGTGRYSIIGLMIPGETLRLHYYTEGQKLQVRTGDEEVYLETKVHDVWAYIKSIMASLKPSNPPAGPSFAPFWGGLMGYVSYEAGLETIGVEPPPSSDGHVIPDICFAYITRSIVFDHKFKKIYVQSIRGAADMEWVEDTVTLIAHRAFVLSTGKTPTPKPAPDPFDTDADMQYYVKACIPATLPRQEYFAAVRACQEYICAGESYELCLTAQNQVLETGRCHVYAARDASFDWRLYTRLMGRNPAPFSAFVRLSNMTILSSSPERFISWDRNGCAQCRPIKGTVRKGVGRTIEDAKAVLNSPKERAENLMILDLVRHQLHGVYGAGNVHVTQLMEIEEYETLWQLVSVVEGVPGGVQKARTPEEWEDPPDKISGKARSSTIGLDAFVASLPPGSMTGAPKKRSCEILKKVENGKRRGVYSGALGYLDVGGGGDFSVVIRTAVKIGRDTEGDAGVTTADKEDEHCWYIGAGGAVTVQSTPSGEFQEMFLKFQSTNAVFNL